MIQDGLGPFRHCAAIVDDNYPCVLMNVGRKTKRLRGQSVASKQKKGLNGH